MWSGWCVFSSSRAAQQLSLLVHLLIHLAGPSRLPWPSPGFSDSPAGPGTKCCPGCCPGCCWQIHNFPVLLKSPYTCSAWLGRSWRGLSPGKSVWPARSGRGRNLLLVQWHEWQQLRCSSLSWSSCETLIRLYFGITSTALQHDWSYQPLHMWEIWLYSTNTCSIIFCLLL